MARLGGLGKGLGALIPTAEGSGDETGDDTPRLEELPIDQITPNPHQPRVHFDEESLSDLAASIREIGVLQPILVRPSTTGTGYQLLAGERRWRAARRAGLSVIPAVVRPTDDLGSVERALVENLHRQDLTALEEAAAYQQLIEEFQLSHEEVARRVGKSRSAVSNMLRLFQLPPSIQKMVAERQLSAGHARALLGTPDRAFQEALARRAIAEELSVRDVEEAVRARAGEAASGTDGDDGAPAAASGAGGAGTAGRRLRPPGLLELESLLSDRLDTRVKVSMGAKRGKVTIEFASLEDLERIYRAMTSPPSADD